MANANAALPFLDTNILLRHLTGDNPEHSPRATALFSSIEAGQLKVHINDVVIFETVYTLERIYHQEKRAIRDALALILSLPGIILPKKQRLVAVLDLYAAKNLPFADAYFALAMRDLKTDTIISFDHHFDRIEGIARREP
ncbi:MAG: PIN domain-containing protein [Kouleothrix sp.]|jgi:predicted nucleic acid-binding protein|nr:PIN domain-containing protein [Kouleothrix sp.]